MPIEYPYKMSDWYGYDKDCAGPGRTPFWVTTSTYSSVGNGCGIVATVPLFHDGLGTLPGNGDAVYQNSSGGSKALWKFFKGFSTTNGGNTISGGRSISGDISNASLCP
jgi:hypothetical protein